MVWILSIWTRWWWFIMIRRWLQDGDDGRGVFSGGDGQGGGGGGGGGQGGQLEW